MGARVREERRRDRDTPGVVDVLAVGHSADDRLGVGARHESEARRDARKDPFVTHPVKQPLGVERPGRDHHVVGGEGVTGPHEWTGPRRGHLPTAAFTWAHRRDRGQSVHHGAGRLSEAEVVLGHRVLGIVAAARHARAALHAALACGADAAEVRISGRLTRAVTEEHADRCELERVADAHVVGHLGEDIVERSAVGSLRDAEHARGLVVERRELLLPVGDAGPLRILEELTRRNVERVGVDQRPTTDPRAAEHDGVREQVNPLDAIQTQARRVEELAHPPRGLGQVLVAEAPPGLEHADAIALLAQAQCGDRATKSGAHHDHVVVDARRLRHDDLPVPFGA